MKSEDERHRCLVPIVHLLAVKPWESHLIFLSPSIQTGMDDVFQRTNKIMYMKVFCNIEVMDIIKNSIKKKFLLRPYICTPRVYLYNGAMDKMVNGSITLSHKVNIVLLHCLV